MDRHTDLDRPYPRDTNMMILAEEAYNEWVKYTGQIWPSWENLDDLRKEHWCRVAAAVVQKVSDALAFDMDL